MCHSPPLWLTSSLGPLPRWDHRRWPRAELHRPAANKVRTAGRSRWKRDYSLVAFESEHDSFEPSGEGTLAHAAADTPARENDPMESLVGYAESGEHSIAYQVTGAGDVDLVLVPGFISHLEYDW